ncbi:NAD dependent epimerase/dehydratase, LLPSF_EDH_00030 family [Algoriphagus alkaliphilus]|uniref:NAD dependent epimerase/dehydratase, LLPSF_EDH_00030 family n=1 Tax=Algoriphagus alkaliphilus TaxID=279824 RepID=A0A1G5Y5A5_9BACT|nr:GDP-mannose 4,6-dehydratase [Algoriphagus alkaliphilus]SDA77752.1 NAD dependent epimerase/dehydratase, LLPSF_EDH_00030 family [Algoriphagus alkaliphilus]
MNYTGKKVLVTGAGGFIGSHLTEELVKAGADVTALVHYNSNSHISNLRFLERDVLNSIRIVFGDIQDGFLMNKLSEGKDIVFHLAALIGIPYSYVAPAAYVSANITGTLNMLEAARSHKTGKLLVTSTSETYGTALYAPIDEKHPMQGQSPYSATKIGADKIAESYFLSFGLPVCIFRPFNTFGPRQSTRAVIPTIISQVLSDDSPAIRLGSLDPVRDMLYVKDTARGYMMAALADNTSGEVVSVGTGRGVTIGEIVEMVQKICGTNKPVIEENQRIRPEKSEVMKLICNYSKAQSLFAWEPQFSLEQGLSNAVEFMRVNKPEIDPSVYAV